MDLTDLQRSNKHACIYLAFNLFFSLKNIMMTTTKDTETKYTYLIQKENYTKKNIYTKVQQTLNYLYQKHQKACKK